MANVFFSYSRVDRATAHPIVKAIEREGYSVWWDSSLLAGAAFRSSITLQLAAAQCVVVAWSDASIHSNWVIDEAEYASKQGKLVPILISDCVPPLGLRQTHTENLVPWLQDPDHPSWKNFILALRAQLERSAKKGMTGEVDETARKEAAELQAQRSWKRRLAIGTVSTIAVGLGLSWFAYTYPYRVASLLSAEVKDDLASLASGVDFQDGFRRLEKWISRGNKWRVLDSLEPERLAEIVSLGHHGNSDRSVIGVLKHLVTIGASDPARIGAALDAVAYVKGSAASEIVQQVETIERELLDLLNRHRAAPPACERSCADEWVYIADTPATGTKAAVGGFCIRRNDTTIRDYRVFDSTHAPTSAETEPARSISWFDAISYARWKRSRLPSLHELERAFQLAGLDVEGQQIYSHAWLLTNSVATIQLIATRARDKLGLYDLLGNVYKWTDTWDISRQEKHQSTYTRAKVIFGASFQTSIEATKLSLLNSEAPFAKRSYIGIRLVRSPTINMDCNFSF